MVRAGQLETSGPQLVTMMDSVVKTVSVTGASAVVVGTAAAVVTGVAGDMV